MTEPTASLNRMAKHIQMWLVDKLIPWARNPVGDSTNSGGVMRLMAGDIADLVFTDPPYNVDYEAYTEQKLKIKGDRMPDADFKQFLEAAFRGLRFGGRNVGATWASGALFRGLSLGDGGGDRRFRLFCGRFHGFSLGGDYRDHMNHSGWPGKQGKSADYERRWSGDPSPQMSAGERR